jgi:hypothetical protein
MSGGGAFGLGKSKSQQTSESTATTESSAYGYSGSVSGDQSQSVSGSSTTQNIAFEDLYKQLFAGSTDAAARGVANGDELGSAARDLFTGGTSFLDSIGNDAGTDYLRNRLSSDNPELQHQVDLLREDTGRLFSENLNPAITSQAVAGGNLGGGRQGVAQGIAAEAAARSFEQGATQLRANDLGLRDAAAMSVASNSLQAAGTGLGALPSLMDVLEKSAAPELGIYSQLSSILGGPTVLSQSQSQSQSVADAFSRSFGEQTSNSRGVSTSTGQGTSSSRNFNMSGYGGIG